MGLTTLSGNPPNDGTEVIPVASGRYGIDDQMRQQEAMTPGMAVSSEDTTNPAKRKNIWKYGSASARPEFFGVVYTKGPSPTLAIPPSTTDADVSSVLYEGYSPLLLAPGQVVRRGQWLEPIPGGTSQAYFRVAPSGRGVAQAREYCDNSGGSAPVFVGCDVIKAPVLAGLIGSVGPSANLTGVTVRTAYGLTVTLPAYSLRLRDRLRIVGSGLSNNIAAGGNVVEGFVNGIGSGQLFAAPSVTFAANDVFNFAIDLYVSALTGSNNVSLSGFVAAGTPGTATARPVPGLTTLDPTVDNVVTITNTPNNVADSSKLLFLSVERVS
jgi:hypothetical protein